MSAKREIGFGAREGDPGQPEVNNGALLGRIHRDIKL